MRVDLQKAFIFLADFNDLIKCGGRFGVILGPLWAYEGDFGNISVRLRGHFGVNLAHEGDFGGTSVSRCGNVWHARVTLGQLRVHPWHMRVPLGPLWRHFGVTLEQRWGHFRYIRMILCHFTIIVGSL